MIKSLEAAVNISFGLHVDVRNPGTIVCLVVVVHNPGAIGQPVHYAHETRQFVETDEAHENKQADAGETFDGKQQQQQQQQPGTDTVATPMQKTHVEPGDLAPLSSVLGYVEEW